MLVIARTTKLTTSSKEKIEDETLEHEDVPKSTVETEFYGGEQAEEPEDDDIENNSHQPWFCFDGRKLATILARHSEIALASKKADKVQL